MLQKIAQPYISVDFLPPAVCHLPPAFFKLDLVLREGERAVAPAKRPAKFPGDCKLCTKEKTRDYKGAVAPNRGKCCARRMLAAEADYVEQRSRIDRGAGCKTRPFLPVLPEVPLRA